MNPLAAGHGGTSRDTRVRPGAPRTTRPAARKKTTRRNRELGTQTLSGGPPARPGRTTRDGGQQQRSTAVRIRPKLAAGAAAAVLALTASACAAESPSGTPAISVPARHAPADTRFTDQRALAQVKRDVAWAAVQRARAGQPHPGTSRFTDQRALGQVKRQAS
jgi:hypothetical protein